MFHIFHFRQAFIMALRSNFFEMFRKLQERNKAMESIFYYTAGLSIIVVILPRVNKCNMRIFIIIEHAILSCKYLIYLQIVLITITASRRLFFRPALLQNWHWALLIDCPFYMIVT